MDSEKKVELAVKLVSPLLTLAAVLIGIWQFNAGQKELKDRDIVQRNFELEKINNQTKAEVLLKFKELQTKQYLEASSVVSYLTVSSNYGSREYRIKLQRFWELYWVELSAVETKDVERAMMDFGEILENLQAHDFSNFQARQRDLKNAGYAVAQAIKKSSNSWELPAALKN